jgi:hypothetical protein
MSDLADFNREEWADKPFTIVLRGGFYDGRRFNWHELPPMWRQPEPAPPLTFTAATFPLTTMASQIPIADYARTDSVTDDGAHVYAYWGHER